ncbi:potassium channel family protein [Streptomyces sp. NPDC048172]|uniref:potassium channel family protein n=1 Tax=Streptomyces sp. NPDC048172 TaxID=3365505 RepID=UPI0037147992
MSRHEEPEREPLHLWARIAVAGAVALAAYFLLPLDVFGPERPELSWTSFGVTLSAVTVLLLHAIRAALLARPGTRPGSRILVLSCLASLIFAAAYYTLARQPGGFDGLTTRLDALYFTIVTLATVGYGDITPKSQAARFVTLLQIGYTFVFLTAAASAASHFVKRQLTRRMGDGDTRS